MPSLGYYEWQQVPSGKQPYFIRSREDEPLVFAGLWDYWNKEGREIISCSIITMEAGGELKEIHRRMPLLLEPDSAMAWLKGSCQEAEGILESPPDVEVMFYPVDPAVGNVRNKGEGLIKPV